MKMNIDDDDFPAMMSNLIQSKEWVGCLTTMEVVHHALVVTAEVLLLLTGEKNFQEDSRFGSIPVIDARTGMTRNVSFLFVKKTFASPKEFFGALRASLILRGSDCPTVAPNDEQDLMVMADSDAAQNAVISIIQDFQDGINRRFFKESE